VLRARLATAAVAIPLLLAIILFPSPWPVLVLIFVLGAVGIAEYATMAFPTRLRDRAFTVGLGMLVLVGMMSEAPRFASGTLALAVAASLVWVLVARADFEQGLRDVGISWVGSLYVGVLLPHFVWLHGLDQGPRWVIFVILIGMAGDTGGYFVGHAVGRHKLIPRVSPGKTVEGAVGIIAASLLGAAIAKLVFLPAVTWSAALWLGGVMGVIGQAGDLCESVMKRTFGAKESGWIFPGHGGVLDRIDSLLFPVTFLFYYLASR
jgi:phosphatidate cytidylyltransferase